MLPDVIKTRLQLQPRTGKRLGIVPIGVRMLQEEGLGSLTRGLAPSMARGVL